MLRRAFTKFKEQDIKRQEEMVGELTTALNDLAKQVQLISELTYDLETNGYDETDTKELENVKSIQEALNSIQPELVARE